MQIHKRTQLFDYLKVTEKHWSPGGFTRKRNREICSFFFFNELAIGGFWGENPAKFQRLRTLVLSNEKIVLKDPETANDGLNGIRFEEWGDKEWLNNNYIRSVRLYLDAYVLGLVKNEAFDKHKSAMKGKFIICQIEPFMGGGAWIHIAFVDDTSFLLRFWVYSFVNENNPIAIEGYDVRGADLIDEPLGLTTEEVKDILKKNPHNQLW